jgi:hypothetical protein
MLDETKIGILTLVNYEWMSPHVKNGWQGYNEVVADCAKDLSILRSEKPSQELKDVKKSLLERPGRYLQNLLYLQDFINDRANYKETFVREKSRHINELAEKMEIERLKAQEFLSNPENQNYLPTAGNVRKDGMASPQVVKLRTEIGIIQSLSFVDDDAEGGRKIRDLAAAISVEINKIWNL